MKRGSSNIYACGFVVIVAVGYGLFAWTNFGSDCAIKGNISRSGERIYHVPGGRWYNATMINPLRGERWFCNEGEARTAGWRRSIR
jgi:hypothetical protein